MSIFRLSNTVRSYAWGGTSAIADLLGVADDGWPKAELWLGAHPDSPSLLTDGSRLDDVIAADAQRLLGAPVADAFGPRLPYLLKVLSVAAPLSLQVHPDASTAAVGFADEERRGVSPDAAQRRYRDPFHKPELVVALGPFEALCGLREPADTLTLLGSLDVEHPGWSRLLDLLADADGGHALRRAVSWLLGGDERLPSLVHQLGRASAAQPDRPEFATVARLAEAYPEDPGVLVALLLNRVSLAAGEALFLPAGNLHAYLHGTAIEIMASSDNVLRAGLTAKHVDAAEVLRVADFTPRPVPAVGPAREGPVSTYRSGAQEFELALVTLGAADSGGWHRLDVGAPRIVLVLHGELDLRAGDQIDRLGRGTSVFVSADAGPMALRGKGNAVVAGVPARVAAS